MTNPKSQTDNQNNFLKLPIDLTKEAIKLEIELLNILDKRKTRVNRDVSPERNDSNQKIEDGAEDRVVDRQEDKDWEIDGDTKAMIPKPKINPGYFEGASKDDYKTQLINDVLTLVSTIQALINDQVAHRKLIDDIRRNSIEEKYKKERRYDTYIWSKFANNIVIHKAPKDLYYGNEHVLSLLNKHHYCTLATTAIAAVVNASYFGSIAPIKNPEDADRAGFILGLITMGVIQVVFKDTIIENTRLDESELMPGVKHTRNHNLLSRNQPPQDFDIKHFGKIAKVKRFWMAAGFTTLIAALSGFNHLTHLDSSAIDELYRHERDKIAEVIDSEAEKENKDFEEYETIVRQLASGYNNEKNLQAKKTSLESKNKLLGLYSQQLEYKRIFNECKKDLKEAGKTKEKLNSTAEQICRANNTGIDKTDPSKIDIKETSKNDENLQKLKEQIKFYGGDYREDQIPVGPKALTQAKFERDAIGDSFSEILQNYYAKKGQKGKYLELESRIKDGRYFAEDIDSKIRYEIGVKRFERDIAHGKFPNGTSQAILIFVIEMLALGTSAMVMGDRSYRYIVLNENVQNFSRDYLLDLTEIICNLSTKINRGTEFRAKSDGDTDISLTKDDIFAIAKKLSQNGNLAGLGSIIETHNSLVSQTPYNLQTQHNVAKYNKIIEIPTRSLDLQGQALDLDVNTLREELTAKDAELQERISQREHKQTLADQNRDSELIKNQARNEFNQEEENNQIDIDRKVSQIRNQYNKSVRTRIEQQGGENLVNKIDRWLDRLRFDKYKKYTIKEEPSPEDKNTSNHEPINSKDNGNGGNSESSSPKDKNIPTEEPINSNGDNGSSRNGS